MADALQEENKSTKYHNMLGLPFCMRIFSALKLWGFQRAQKDAFFCSDDSMLF